MGTVRRFIIFQLGVHFFGVEIQYVKVIVKNIPMEKKTNPVSEIVGILNMPNGVWDSRLIPVLSLQLLFKEIESDSIDE